MRTRNIHVRLCRVRTAAVNSSTVAVTLAVMASMLIAASVARAAAFDSFLVTDEPEVAGRSVRVKAARPPARLPAARQPLRPVRPAAPAAVNAEDRETGDRAESATPVAGQSRESGRPEEVAYEYEEAGELIFEDETVVAPGYAQEYAEGVVPEYAGLGDGYTVSDAGGCCGTGCTGGCGQCGSCGPKWTFQVDALMLWRNNIASRTLYTTTATDGPIFDVNQLQAPLSVGPRFGLFRHLDECTTMEGNYFQVSPFAGEYTTPPSAGAYAQNDIAGFSNGGIGGARAISSALIQSAEWNLRRNTGGAVTWLAGFRWVEWNEYLNITDTPTGAIPNVFDSRTGNDLYGGQIGLDALLWNTGGRLRVNGLGKAGVYGNTAYQRTLAEVDQGGTVVRLGPASASRGTVAFFGELGANATFDVTNWLSWRLGYSLFWLSGVATPAEQLSLTNLTVTPGTAGISTGDSVLLQGVTTGLEARW